MNLFKSRDPGNHWFVLRWKKRKRFVTKAMIMYKLVMHMNYQSWVLSIDLYNCQFDFRWCFIDDFHLYFSANDKIKDIKSKPKNTAQMVRHVYIIVILRKPINKIKMLEIWWIMRKKNYEFKLNCSWLEAMKHYN